MFISLSLFPDLTSVEILSNCTAFLLSVTEWDYLSQLNVKHGIIMVRKLVFGELLLKYIFLMDIFWLVSA